MQHCIISESRDEEGFFEGTVSRIGGQQKILRKPSAKLLTRSAELGCGNQQMGISLRNLVW
jgi:hypothetical protein